MSVLIKGMEMPTNCRHCPCADDGSRYCKAANEYIPMLGKPKFCPLIEVPTPHGRLIDETQIPYIDLNADMPQSKVRVWTTFKDKIDRLPTIIEAEEEE